MIPAVPDRCGKNGSLKRLRQFYAKALNVIGWNKYKRINVEFSNQIVCKRK